MTRRTWAAFLATACFLGCTGGDEDAGAGRTEIRYMRWADPAELAATREAIDAFERAYPDIAVKLEYTAWGQYHAKLQTLIAGGDAPDVVALSGAWVHDLRVRNVLEDLMPYVEADSGIALSDYFSVPVDTYRTKEGLFGLPRDCNVIALFYNRTLFDEAHMSYPDSTWTWDTLRRAARVLTRDRNGDGRTDQWGIQVSNDMEVCWANYVFQNDGHILDETKTHFRMNEPAAIGAFDYLVALLHEDGSSPSPLDMESLSDAPFRSGRLAMITSGSWTLAKLDEAEGLDYGVALLPKGRVRATVANGVANGIPRSSAHKAAAWTLVAYLSGPEGQRRLARSGTSIPARKDVANSPDFLGAGRPDVDRTVFLQSLEIARPLPFTPGLARWGTDVLQALDRVWLGERSPEDALNAVAPAVDAVLATVEEPS